MVIVRVYPPVGSGRVDFGADRVWVRVSIIGNTGTGRVAEMVDRTPLKMTPKTIQGGGPLPYLKYLNRCNSAADFSISLNFDNEFDTITPDVPQTFKGQGHRVT